ncbi:hypothetical protein [Chamaesiphon sp. VAR_48_metabat_135_sub]|uniref:hypothetical protein n=1 Tax=Chamaesiphon sp. VAR_48_metabat_135_sub TaxID=2964699 RepID=UPI00286ACC93|nr:hypothetical protein [Chamaesiphon sp. VAR_48_metabat_135_sub]
MSDRDTVIQHSAELEKILDNLGAEGTGLGQKSIGIKHLLTLEINQKLKFICYVRNQAAHEVEFQCDRLDLFLRNCDEVKQALSSLDSQRIAAPNPQNTSDRSSNNSNFTEFSISTNLSEFSGIRFRSVTGRVVRSQDRNHITRSGKNTITERTQKIWLRRSNGKEEYLELDDAVTGQIRQGHLITVVYAQTKIRENCVAVWIDELAQYFYHNTNVNGAIIDTCIFKSRLPTLNGIKNRVLVPGQNPWKLAAIIAIVTMLCGSYLIGILIMLGSLLVPMFVLTKVNPETFLNLVVIGTSNNVNKKRLLNHIDRIFGHQLIEY